MRQKAIYSLITFVVSEKMFEEQNHTNGNLGNSLYLRWYMTSMTVGSFLSCEFLPRSDFLMISSMLKYWSFNVQF